MVPHPPCSKDATQRFREYCPLTMRMVTCSNNNLKEHCIQRVGLSERVVPQRKVVRTLASRDRLNKEISWPLQEKTEQKVSGPNAVF